MTPQEAYRYLNRVLWLNRLPDAKVETVENEIMPRCWGVTVAQPGLAKPIIFLNAKNRKWEITLIHEMIHVAEPNLPDGKLFDSLVQFYWNRAKQMKAKVF